MEEVYYGSMKKMVNYLHTGLASPLPYFFYTRATLLKSTVYEWCNAVVNQAYIL